MTCEPAQNQQVQTVIEAIATSNPPFCATREQAVASLMKVTSLSDSIRRRIPQVYAVSGIDRRYTCVQDYLREAEDFDFYPKSWSLSPPPSTAARNRKYMQYAVDMAESAALQCLEKTNTKAGQITHLIVVSCTGFFAPGIDIHLVRRLGLLSTTSRTVVGFMGCYAAFNGLRVADSICKSTPGARVLLVCAELCTLHFQIENSIESVVVNSLFADGCAAVLVSSRTSQEAAGSLCYEVGLSMMDDDSLDYMTWEIGDTGFLMGLSPRVPDVLARCLPEYVRRLLATSGLNREEIDFWAVHPGGRQILDKACTVLELREHEIDDSYEVLRLYGNMSSPTILFILKRILDRRAKDGSTTSPRCGIALAFGPGLTVEGCVLRVH